MTETSEDDAAINSIYVYNGVDAVPSTVTHVKVDSSLTHFSPSDFWRFGSVVKVELPGGIRTIGSKAFSFCRLLKSIDVPSTVTEIGELAFDNCHHLDDIVLPRGLVKLGEGAFYNCISLQTIHIPPLIQTIEARTFLGCTSLTEVILPLDLQEIKKYAFRSCVALVTIDFPSSLRVIGELAFDSAGLTEFHLPDSVEDWGTFSKCYLTNLRMPPLITKFDASTFGVEVDSDTIVSIELPEHIEQVMYPSSVQKRFYELQKFAYPAKCSVYIGDDMEEDEKYFLHDLVHRFQHRFDGLPLHKLCYYHSYHDTAKVLLDMKRVIHPWSTKTRCGKLSDIGNRQDCIGMTPLHILACSTKQPLAIYQSLVEKYPENLVTKDKRGSIPLHYAFRCNAPLEIIEFLAESYISKYADFELDWDRLILVLAQCCAPLHRIQILLDTYRRCFPKKKVNWIYVARSISSFPRYVSDKTLQFLLRAAMEDRLDSLNVRRWSLFLCESINMVCRQLHEIDLEMYTGWLYNEIDIFESYKEATTLLELALWKAAIDRFPKNKKARIDKQHSYSYREQCRINCGAEIVLPNVLPFLWRSVDGPGIKRCFRYSLFISEEIW